MISVNLKNVYSKIKYYLKNKKLNYLIKYRVIFEKIVKHFESWNTITTINKNIKWLSLKQKNTNSIFFKITVNSFKFFLIIIITSIYCILIYSLLKILTFLINTIYLYLTFLAIILKKKLTNVGINLFSKDLKQIQCTKNENNSFDTIRNKYSNIIYDITNNTSNNDSSSTNFKLLKLLKKSFIISNLLKKLDAQESITDLKKLTRKDLNWNETFKTTSDNSKISSLKIWTNAMSLQLEDKYQFDWKKSRQSSTYNPDWDLNNICKELKISQDLIEFINLSEDIRLNKFNMQKLNPIFFSFEKFQNLSKINKWLSKNTFISNQNITNTNLTTNIKKLLLPYGYTSDLTKTNLWVTNNIINQLKANHNTTFNKNIENLYKNCFSNDYFNLEKINFQNKINIFNYVDETLSKYHEESFFWLIQRLNFIDNTENRLLKLNLNLKQKKSLANNNLKNLYFLNYQLNNIFTTIKQDVNNINTVEIQHLDIFYNSTKDTLFNVDNLSYLYEITNTKSNNKGTTYRYNLNKYSKFLPNNYDVESFILIENEDELRSVLKNQLDLSLAPIDLLNKEHTKNLYRYIMLNKKK